MSVYVDTPVEYPDEVAGYVGHTRSRYRWCHMFADSLEELHVMANTIGLRRRWFQEHPRLPHYDLVPSKRALAIRYGALAVTRRQLGERLRSTKA